MTINVKIKNQSRRMVVRGVPATGHRYTFFKDKPVGVITDGPLKEQYAPDVEYFKGNDRYEVEGVKSAAKKVVDGVKGKLKGKPKEGEPKEGEKDKGAPPADEKPNGKGKEGEE